ncbi:adenosylcobinamide amidohydrolase [Hyphomicrobium sp.]|uniref:adenosylcobinamide amidohydrolase n=1 Tax=Hyphomicrobium sp. TaxID=82 RepID=UPI003F7009BF
MLDNADENQPGGQAQSSSLDGGPRLPFALSCRAPFLVASFGAPQAMLSWSLTKPGFQTARQVAWLEVRNADLPPGADPLVWIGRQFSDANLSDAVTLVTSRSIAQHHLAQATVDGCTATCLATVGLSNGERVGQRSTEPVRVPGTINILLHVSQALSQAAMIETVSIVTQARTLAVIEAFVPRAGVQVTGTGTDCIVVAAPSDGEAANFAGLHTGIGEAVGRAVYHVMREGIAVWREHFFGLDRSRTAKRT